MAVGRPRALVLCVDEKSQVQALERILDKLQRLCKLINGTHSSGLFTRSCAMSISIARPKREDTPPPDYKPSRPSPEQASVDP
jgi:hypothetical protein